MVEVIQDSETVGRKWCPGCEPGADPHAEILDTVWCAGHAPARNGSEDAQAQVSGVSLSAIVAGGDVNREICELFHRQIPEERRRVAEAAAKIREGEVIKPPVEKRQHLTLRQRLSLRKRLRRRAERKHPGPIGWRGGRLYHLETEAEIPGVPRIPKPDREALGWERPES